MKTVSRLRVDGSAGGTIIMANYTRFSLEDRIMIQTQLSINASFKTISILIHKSATSVAREVKNYSVPLDTFGMGNRTNRCVHRTDCKKQDLCAGMSYLCRHKMCSKCSKQKCAQICTDYREDHCEKLKLPPYVCNACSSRSGCPLMKKIYDAGKAEEAARARRTDSRSGLNMTEAELKDFDEQISCRLRLGQSVHHIFASSPDLFTISEKQAYILIKNGCVSAKPIDLPRMVRMRPRMKKSVELKVDKKCRIGRVYTDYLNFMKDHPDEPVLQGDTVEGTKGGKCILTLTWYPWDFQLGFLRDRNNSASVTAIVDHLYAILGCEQFHRVFPSVWLVDNGTEFSNPSAIEKYGIRVFYCDPSAPYQKGSCENTHEHFRRICPKGTSFNEFTQNVVNLIFSHTNSMYRKKLNDHSPYDLFSSLCGKGIDIYDVFHITRIDAELVNLTPSLLSAFYLSLQKTKK